MNQWITAVEKQIARYHEDTVECLNCGAPVLLVDDSFCPKCQNEIEEKVE